MYEARITINATEQNNELGKVRNEEVEVSHRRRHVRGMITKVPWRCSAACAVDGRHHTRYGLKILRPMSAWQTRLLMRRANLSPRSCRHRRGVVTNLHMNGLETGSVPAYASMIDAHA